MTLFSLGVDQPDIHDAACVAGSATIIGKFRLALVLQGKVSPDNTLIVGVPAKAKRELSADEVQGLRANAADCVARARRYRAEPGRVGGPAIA